MSDSCKKCECVECIEERKSNVDFREVVVRQNTELKDQLEDLSSELGITKIKLQEMKGFITK